MGEKAEAHTVKSPAQTSPGVKLSGQPQQPSASLPFDRLSVLQGGHFSACRSCGNRASEFSDGLNVTGLWRSVAGPGETHVQVHALTHVPYRRGDRETCGMYFCPQRSVSDMQL